MNETYRKARVYVQNCRAGWIEETENGYRFRYDAAYIDRRDAHATPDTRKVIKAIRDLDDRAFINCVRTSELKGNFYFSPKD
mgnify:CR=1 FL=1